MNAHGVKKPRVKLYSLAHPWKEIKVKNMIWENKSRYPVKKAIVLNKKSADTQDGRY